MKIDIDRIKVDEASRIRRDTGDLSELQNSIKEVGLINPILIDEQDRLIAGYRRLCACRKLDWKEIEVNVVVLEDDELKMLEAEAAENMFRKDFTSQEILTIHKRREEIEEARRHKGIFERFWIWLKSLFAPKPKPEVEAAVVPEPAAPEAASEPVEKTEDTVTAEESVTQDEPVEKAAEQDEPELKSEPVQEATDYIPKQPTSAEIVEENGVRHIKWR